MVPIVNGREEEKGIIVQEVWGSDVTDKLMQMLSTHAAEINTPQRFRDFNQVKEAKG